MHNPLLTRKILSFWFGDPSSPEYNQSKSFWFQSTPQLDQKIKDDFEEYYHLALNSGEAFNTAEESLAHVLLFDQLPRNMFRNTPKAFATDALALNITKSAIELKQDLQLLPMQRKFLYMPFMHSENLTQQNTGVSLFKTLNEPMTVDFAIRHRDIIKKFDRFPHRNIILNRPSTTAELEFLKQPGSSF